MKKTFFLSLIAVSVFSMAIAYTAEAYMNKNSHMGADNRDANTTHYSQGNRTIATQAESASYTHGSNVEHRNNRGSMNRHKQNTRSQRSSCAMQHNTSW